MLVGARVVFCLALLCAWPPHPKQDLSGQQEKQFVIEKLSGEYNCGIVIIDHMHLMKGVCK